MYLPLKRQKILLGITGGIAAYKSAELCRLLIKNGADVRVIMSDAACEFITPLTMETLSGKPVPVKMFQGTEGTLEHIDLGDQADFMLVAPATADYIARCALGRSSDLISSVTLAFAGPKIIAPAMNTNMWNNPATQKNLRALQVEQNYDIVAPDSGELACGIVGTGRMASPADILEFLVARQNHDLRGKQIIVTAGPTVEDIDPVRYISNRSSGKTGYAIAERAARRGASVTLISGPTQLTPPSEVRYVPVRTAIEMQHAIDAAATEADGIIMCAAVADYRPLTPSPHKLKKGASQNMTLTLVKNPDILAELGQRYKGATKPKLVGFALETENLIEAARKKLKNKGADIIIANLAAAALEGNSTQAVIVKPETAPIETGPVTKRQLADTILDELI